MSDWTPERIAELRASYWPEAHIHATLDEIERLQARVEEWERRLTAAKTHSANLADVVCAGRERDQRREQLLRECLSYMDPTKPVLPGEKFAGRIRAELGDAG